MSGRGLTRTVQEAADARRRRFLWKNIVFAIYAAARQSSDGPSADSEVADINENFTCSSTRYVPRITCSYVTAGLGGSWTADGWRRTILDTFHLGVDWLEASARRFASHLPPPVT